MTDAVESRYSWSPLVAAQVGALPELGSGAFWTLVEHTDRFSGQTLRAETLVIVLRRLQAAGDADGVRRVATALVLRWDGWAHERAWTFFPNSPEDRDDFVNTLYTKLLTEILDSSETFWEANFLHALTYLASDIARPFWRARRVLTESDLRREGDSEGDAALDTIDPAAGPESVALVREALSILDGPERTAVYLHVIEGWPIVDNRHGGPSVSQHLGVTDRTVRNYIARGLAKLRDYYAGQGGMP